MKFDLEKMRAEVLRMLDQNNEYNDNDNDFDEEIEINAQSNLDFKINLSFVNKSNNPDPEYATAGSSGFDLRANLTKEIRLSPKGGFAIIPTGLFFEIPDNFEIQIRSRSGLAAKNQVAVLNSPGTIDADYRGEIKVILINHGLNEFEVKHGDRIAQGIVANVIAKNILNLNKISEISEDTQRGSGGFGSTGTN